MRKMNHAGKRILKKARGGAGKSAANIDEKLPESGIPAVSDGAGTGFVSEA